MADTHDDKTPQYESLRVDRSGGVVTITLDRPAKKNAINGAMWDELSAVVGEIARRSADRVVVFTGAGGDFCSGADLSEPSEGEHHLARLRRVGDLCLADRPAPAADDRQGPRRRGRCRAQPGAGVRPRGRRRGRPVLRDLRQARAQPRLRRFVDPPAADRDAPGQGAGAAGAHHRRRRGGRDRAA